MPSTIGRLILLNCASARFVLTAALLTLGPSRVADAQRVEPGRAAVELGINVAVSRVVATNGPQRYAVPVIARGLA